MTRTNLDRATSYQGVQCQAIPLAGWQPPAAANRPSDIGAKDLMHATLHRRPFTATGWAFELKLDGLRVLARRVDGRVQLLSRRGLSLAGAFPKLVSRLERVQGDWVLDGAIIFPHVRRRPDWEALPRRAVLKLKPTIFSVAREKPACLCLFDVLFNDGDDFRALPLWERQVRLSGLVVPNSNLQIVSSLESHGNALFDQALAMGFDGIVAKRLDSPYRRGRQETWLKIRSPY